MDLDDTQARLHILWAFCEDLNQVRTRHGATNPETDAARDRLLNVLNLLGAMEKLDKNREAELPSSRGQASQAHRGQQPSLKDQSSIAPTSSRRRSLRTLKPLAMEEEEDVDPQQGSSKDQGSVALAKTRRSSLRMPRPSVTEEEDELDPSEYSSSQQVSSSRPVRSSSQYRTRSSQRVVETVSSPGVPAGEDESSDDASPPPRQPRNRGRDSTKRAAVASKPQSRELSSSSADAGPSPGSVKARKDFKILEGLVKPCFNQNILADTLDVFLRQIQSSSDEAIELFKKEASPKYGQKEIYLPQDLWDSESKTWIIRKAPGLLEKVLLRVPDWLKD